MKIKNFCISKMASESEKKTGWENNLQIFYLLMDYYPEYIKNITQ